MIPNRASPLSLRTVSGCGKSHLLSLLSLSHLMMCARRQLGRRIDLILRFEPMIGLDESLEHAHLQSQEKSWRIIRVLVFFNIMIDPFQFLHAFPSRPCFRPSADARRSTTTSDHVLNRDVDCPNLLTVSVPSRYPRAKSFWAQCEPRFACPGMSALCMSCYIRLSGCVRLICMSWYVRL
jgi:hypothetical protein